MKFLPMALAAFAATMLPLAAPAAEQPVAEIEQQPMEQVPGVYRVALGAFKVTVLTDGTLPVPFGALIHGMNKPDLAATLRNAGLPLDRETSINSFLIDTGDHRLLVDAGSGTLFGDCCGRLPAMLRAAGYSPDAIDAVLLTHVHGDHSGGLVKDGQRVFPNADLYLAQAELDYWLSDQAKARAKPSHLKMFEEGRAALAPYQAAGRIRTFNGPTTLFPGVRTIPAPGHTPGHSFFEIESHGQRLRLLGDITHIAEVQLPYPEVAIDFDADEAQAAKTRKAALEELANTHELVAGAHISFPGLGHVVHSGSGYGWSALPYSTAIRQVGQ